MNGDYVVTTTGINSFTYAQSGANSSSTGGTISVLTGGFAIYPMAEVLSVFDPIAKSIDGQMTLAPNNVAWADNDSVEEPHYYQESVTADTEFIGQSVPRPSVTIRAGMQYQQNNGPGLVGWSIANAAPSSNYLGYGGTHAFPDVAYEGTGIWKRTMSLTAGEQAAFAIHCNLHGCGNWNSGYNLFELDSSASVDLMSYSPTTSSLSVNMRGTPYSFSPQAFTAGTINVGTLNATTISGGLNGASINSGTIAPAYLPLFGPSGTAHASGIVPDPGATAGSTRFLREDGTWAAPSGTLNATEVNGGAVPASAVALGSNASSQLVAATIAGAGAALTTGPTAATSGDFAAFTGAAGQIADSAIAGANVLQASNTLASDNIGWNLAPVMTSDTTPSGTVSANSFYSTNPPWLAFQNRTITSPLAWVSNFDGLPAWLQYQFPTAVLAGSYTVTPSTNNSYTRWDGLSKEAPMALHG